MQHHCRSTLPESTSEEEISAGLAAFEGFDPLYLVVHFPPADTALDEFAPGKQPSAARRCENGLSVSNRRVFSAGTSTRQQA